MKEYLEIKKDGQVQGAINFDHIVNATIDGNGIILTLSTGQNIPVEMTYVEFTKAVKILNRPLKPVAIRVL